MPRFVVSDPKFEPPSQGCHVTAYKPNELSKVFSIYHWKSGLGPFKGRGVDYVLRTRLCDVVYQDVHMSTAGRRSFQSWSRATGGVIVGLSVVFEASMNLGQSLTLTLSIWMAGLIE